MAIGERRAATTVLTSIIRRLDRAGVRVIQDYLDGRLEPGTRQVTVADQMMTYTQSGDAMSTEHGPTSIERSGDFAAGIARPPRTPSGELAKPAALLEQGTGTVFFAGARDVLVTFDLPAEFGSDGRCVRLQIRRRPTHRRELLRCVEHLRRWLPMGAGRSAGRSDRRRPVATLASAPGFGATEASDVTVDGFDGKYLEFTVPDYDDGGPGGHVRPLEGGRSGRGEHGRPSEPLGPGPGQRNRTWILDVDGTRLVVLAWTFPGHLGARPGRPRRDPRLHPHRLTSGRGTDRTIVGTAAPNARTESDGSCDDVVHDALTRSGIAVAEEHLPERLLTEPSSRPRPTTRLMQNSRWPCSTAIPIASSSATPSGNVGHHPADGGDLRA